MRVLVRVLDTEVTCRDPTLVSVSESVLDPQSLSQAGTPGAWGAPVISV